MKKFKKLLAGFMTLAMLVTTLPATAFAAEADLVVISDAAGLQAFAEDVNNGNSYAGKTVVLGADIDLSGIDWEPIGQHANRGENDFEGIFDGGGFTISNMTVNVDGKGKDAGLFGGTYAGKAKIMNVTLDNATVTGNHYVAGIIGFMEASNTQPEITKCVVKNSSITAIPDGSEGSYDNGDKVGGIVGYAHGVKVIGNTAKNVTLTGYRDIGGIVGCASDETSEVKDNAVEDIKITVDQKTNYYEDKDANAGAVVGRFSGNAPAADDSNEQEAVTIKVKIKDAVAEVNGVQYATLQEAIVAAAPDGTVEILSDVTVDTWLMFDQSLTNNEIITLNMDGLTINGNGKKLTVNNIESGGNGGRLFRNAKNLNINNLTIEYADGVTGGITLQSGTIDNVTFIGGKAGVVPGNGEVTIKNSTFETNGSAIYYEEARDNLTVTGNTFDIGEDNYVIILRGNEVFTDNQIISGKVNVRSGSPTVSGNEFAEGMRFKVYNDATATIEDNTLTYVVFDEEGKPVQSTFAGNILSDEAQAALNAAGVVNVMPVIPSTPSNGGSTSKSYKAEVEDVDNGSIRLDRTKAKSGTEVTITATPDAGYVLGELKVLNSRGNEIAVTDNGDGTFSFKMPKGGVEIEASFVEGEDAPAVDVKDERTLVLTIGQLVYLMDGQPGVNDVAPIIKGERTMLPIRLIAEFLDATVTWNEAEQSVTIVKDDTTIVIYIGQAFALVNGEPVQLDAPAFIANDRTYLPLRFVAENLGATVTWNSTAQTVTIVG